MLTFKDFNPNVQDNHLPNHGASIVNMVDGCPEDYRVFDVRFIRGSLVEMHRVLCGCSDFSMIMMLVGCVHGMNEVVLK